MSTQTQLSNKVQQWKNKFQLACNGNNSNLQEVKKHIFADISDNHPIFKQQLENILKKGYEINGVKKLNSINRKNYDSFTDIPLIFLIQGCLQIRCITLEGDFEQLGVYQNKGIVQLDRNKLLMKMGEEQLNNLTFFEIVARQDSIVAQFTTQNPIHKKIQQKPITQQTLQQKTISTIMNNYYIMPMEQPTKIKVTDTKIKTPFYLLSGKVCYFLDDQKQFGSRVILCCYEEGYFDPIKYQIQKWPNTHNTHNHKFIKTNQKNNEQYGNNPQSKPKPNTANSIKSSFSAIGRSLRTPNSLKRTQLQSIKKQQQPQQHKIDKKCNIKLYIFEGSQIIYLNTQFVRQEYIRCIENKRQEHLRNIMDSYRNKSEGYRNQKQQKLVKKYRLSQNVVKQGIYKIQSSQKSNRMEIENIRQSKNRMKIQGKCDKKTTSQNQLRSTASSVKSNIRIRKSNKKTMQK